MSKKSKGQRAFEQREKRRAQKRVATQAIHVLEELRKEVRSRMDWKAAIAAAVAQTKRDRAHEELARLQAEWNTIGGPQLVRRLARLEDAYASRSNAKQVREACRAVFGAPPTRDVVISHNRADVAHEWDRLGDEVLYSWLEIRGVRGVVQSGGSQMQIQKEVRQYSWRIERYRFEERNIQAAIAWLKRNIPKVRDKSAELQTQQLENRLGRAVAVRDETTLIRVQVDPETIRPPAPQPPERHIAIERNENGRKAWDVYTWGHASFCGRFLDWERIKRNFPNVTDNPDDWRPKNQSTYWAE